MFRRRLAPPLTGLVAILITVFLSLAFAAPAAAKCTRADVVAFDQVFFWNRLGAVQPQGMIYALRHDVVPIDSGQGLVPGNVMLREGERPRPLILRTRVGECLQIDFQNLLANSPQDEEQPHTRAASIHVVGLEVLSSIADDGTNVGDNPAPGGLVWPGQSTSYLLLAGEREGEHVMHSAGAMTGGEGDGGSTPPGLFGAVLVEPANSSWYRSDVTRQEIDWATERDVYGNPVYTLSGHPKLDWDAVYPNSHPLAGKPILAMEDLGSDLIHGDLRAIIVGSHPESQQGGRFPDNLYPPNPVYPDRAQPFREFVTVYHDEIGAVQAFPIFEDPVFSHTTHSGRDAFAINYGTGGIGAEILANRFDVGPMWDCVECKYEEFFLSAWTVGDPAMVVDVPANAPCMVDTDNPNEVSEDPDFDDKVDHLRHWYENNEVPCDPTVGPKATKAFFPEDPSNVYRSYLGDHVKFRILHAGPKEHHVHHQHAHQWLFAPDGDESSYLDSQALGPGSSFTLEMVHNGSGNRNQTVGDSIFHCHFYPHFAQGMWAMWRVQDVFEWGTVLDNDGRPAPGSRALPDGEIAAGTPIPAVIPLPGLPMAPLPQRQVSISGGQVVFGPGNGNPGFPFYIPGVAGHRPPHPPLDFAITVDNQTIIPPIDGGLPRHVIVDGEAFHLETRLDFTKIIEVAEAVELPEAGTAEEIDAMVFHEQREHPTCTPGGSCDTAIGGGSNVDFIANGLPRVSGAPFADPCIDDQGSAIGRALFYSAADIQLDVIFNKVGWHFPQQRMLALAADVDPTLNKLRPPEPLFFRANTFDCITFHLTNLVPANYELDDFQVRTPTDILGQHIHLVKFDVTASDGAGNGWNYEDGTFSPEEVRERMHAIRRFNSCLGDEVNGGDPRDGTFECPVAERHPYFGGGPDENGDGVPDWLGAQTTVQRWFADDVLNLAGEDRTLRTVFTHDHFGPSTHQQAGLYAGLVIEPELSTWHDPQTGAPYGTRFDGGPTSWKADIHDHVDPDMSFREFLLEFGDFQLAYEAGNNAFPDPDKAINPPGRMEPNPILPDLVIKPNPCPGGVQPPCPEMISADDVGTMSVNYRNEPVALRVYDPHTDAQAADPAGDLAFAFHSKIDRADDRLDVQPAYPQPLSPNVQPSDPFTPLLEAFENDRVHIRILVGAHEEGHNFSVNGLKWLFEPSEANSGWRNSQMMGISEHFEFEVPQLLKNPNEAQVDYLWAAGSSTDDLWNGLWGILRVYRPTVTPPPPPKGQAAPIVITPTLRTLPNNPQGGKPVNPNQLDTIDPSGVCPTSARPVTFNLVAVAAAKALPPPGPGWPCPIFGDCGALIYNSRSGAGNNGPLTDSTAIMYVHETDLDAGDSLLPGVPTEPLVLRVRSGDCVRINLRNALPAAPEPMPDAWGYATLPMLIERFNMNDLRPSRHVGLHPQLLHYDVSTSDGNNVGFNPIQTAAPTKTVTYDWYAGDIRVLDNGSIVPRSIEFGATGLIPADRIKQPGKGAVGALIVEPTGANWTVDSDSRTRATVTPAFGTVFREQVLVFQNHLNLNFSFGNPIPNLAETEDPEDSGQRAINYRTEPMWFRLGFAPDTPLSTTRTFQFAYALHNSQVGGVDPETPVFTVKPASQVRFRIVHPGGSQRNNAFTVHGHAWEQEPYTNDSRRLGESQFSMFEGTKMGIGPSSHFDLLLRHGAGGASEIPGDYLLRDFVGFHLDGGQWGLMRVEQ